MPYTPASIRYNNPGAQYPGPSAKAYGSTGYGTIGGGHLIAQFPDPVSGAAAQFDLLTNGPYSKMPLGQAIRKWSGNNSSDAYIRSIADETGLDPSKPVTRQELADPNVAIPLAKAMAKFEAGRDYPLADEDWQAAHSLAFGGGAPSAEPYATGGPAGLPVQQPYSGLLDPNEEPPATGNPLAGNPMQATDMPLGIPQGGGGATEFSAQRRMPTGQAGAPAPPPGPPTGNLPFGIPGTAFNNPIQQALGDNFSTLLAFAGGARQGGIGQGLTQAAKASLIEGPQTEARKQLNQQQFATYQALVANGLAPGLARAASLDPKLLAQVEKMAPQVTSRGKDILGRDQFVVRNPLTGQEQPYVPGQSISGMGTTAAPAAGVSGTPQVQNNSQEIARSIGVKNWANVNEDLPAEEYLAQFPKEVQAAVRNKVDNNIPFPSNPRQGQETATNLVGQLYAEKAGIPIDANTIKLRKEYLAGLQKTNPASVGGQRQGYNTMAQHGATVTEAAVALGNSDLGLTPLSGLFNSMKNLTSANKEKVNDLRNGVQKWNAEVEKLYAGGQGSITAREHAEALIDPNASPREIAGTIRSQQELVAGKLKALQAAHEEALPPRFQEKHKMIFPGTEEALARMSAGVAELKKQSDRPLTEQIFGGTPAAAAAPTAAPAAAAPVKITSKAEYDKLPKGTPYIAPDGSSRVKQ